MSQLQEAAVTVVKKSAAPVTAFTTSISFATMFSMIPTVIGGIGTAVGIVVTVVIAVKKNTILKQEEALNEQQKEINRLDIISRNEAINHNGEGE